MHNYVHTVIFNTVENVYSDIGCGEVSASMIYFSVTLDLQYFNNVKNVALQRTTENINIGYCEVFLFAYNNKPLHFYCLAMNGNIISEEEKLEKRREVLCLFLECGAVHLF